MVLLPQPASPVTQVTLRQRRVGEYSRDLLVSTGLHDLPAGSAYTTDLRGDITEHLVADILITAIQDIANSTYTNPFRLPAAFVWLGYFAT